MNDVIESEFKGGRKFMKSKMGAFVLLGVSLLVSGSYEAAQAQTSQTRAPLISRSDNEIKYTLGFGVEYGAKYVGSDDYTSTALPFIAVQYGVFFLDPARGLGAEFSSESGFYAAASAQVDRGRDDEDELRGMGRVRSSTTFDLALSQALTQWLVVDAAASLRMAGQKDRGNLYRTGLTVIPYESDSDVLTIGVSTQFGDRDYNQTYFGVTQAQSGRTKYSEFKAAGGLNSYSLDLGWSHFFDRNWSLDAGIGMTKVSGKAKDSPIVEKDTNYSVAAGISYNF